MAQELNVNAHNGAIRASERNRQQRRLQGVFQPCQSPVTNTSNLSWWRQILERWFKWESLIVAGRTIEKGWVMPQALGIGLILAMISCTAVLYWRIIDKQAVQDHTWSEKFDRTNELLIRLDERLKNKNETDNQRFQELKQEIQSSKDHMAAVETVTSTKIAELKAQRK